MKITPQLTAHLVSLGACAQGANEEAVKSAATECLMDGRMTSVKYQELAKEPEAEEVEDFTLMLKDIQSRLPPEDDKPAKNKNQSNLPRNLSGLLAGGDGDNTETKAGGNIRVKRAREMYSTTKSAQFFPEEIRPGLRHRLAGQPLYEGDGVVKKRFIEGPSELDKAICGAYIKVSMSHKNDGLPPQFRVTEHDLDLFLTAVDDYEWGGVIGSDCSSIKGTSELMRRRIDPNKIMANGKTERKALLDDATSGGLEAAPIVFDDMIITTPLLFGEFYPNVHVVPITRGRRIEGVSIGVPTIQSGGADNDNIDLFTTTAFIAAFDTTIFVADAAIEIGLDFLSDSPIDITAAVVDGYSRALLAWLDEQICIGDGTTEPEGITVASGTASVAGGSAAPTVGVYESFFFGVAKRFKQGYSSDRMQFGANELTYQRARAIAVGASDARRIFGMTHGDYMLMGHKYGISDNMPNTKAFFANMARYRMYRRLGMTIKATTEGQTLVRKNLMMISCRSRWGGHLELGGAAAVSNTMMA